MTALAQSAPQLDFAVEDAAPVDRAAVPTVRFGVRVARPDGGAVRALALTVQIRIAATRRGYDEPTQRRLVDLFGRPEDWGRNLHSVLWTVVSVNAPPFEGETIVDLHVPCTYDFEVAASKYLDAVRDGDIPLELLFGGTVFHTGDDGRLQVAPIPWDREARFALPAATWRAAMEAHFPGAAWLRLGRDSFDRLYSYRVERGLLSWEDTVDSLLLEAE